MTSLENNKRKNLYCLVVANSNYTDLNLIQVDKYNGKLKIDLEKQIWKQEGDWKEIGKYESNCQDIRLVFDWTNFEHFKEALKVTADFHR